MPLKKFVSYCQLSDSFQAGRVLMEDILKASHGERPDVVFLFCTVEHDYAKLIAGINETAGREVSLCGCTGTGIITNLGCDEAIFSAAAMAIISKDVSFRPFIFPDLANHATQIGESIAGEVRAALPDDSRNGIVILMPDGHNHRTTLVMESLVSSLGRHIDCVGGNASNDMNIDSTFQFCGTTIMRDSVCGAVVSGDFNYAIGLSHGSRAIGRPMKITRSRENFVYEIDGEPALEVIARTTGKNMLTDFSQWSSFNALSEAFADRNYPEDVIIKAILRADEKEKSLILTTGLPEGSEVRMAFRDKERILERTTRSAAGVVERMKRPDEAAYFYFDCAARGSYLFGEPDPDVERMKEGLGNRDVIGFFTFGEIAPVSGKNYFHNHTGVILAIE